MSTLHVPARLVWTAHWLAGLDCSPAETGGVIGSVHRHQVRSGVPLHPLFCSAADFSTAAAAAFNAAPLLIVILGHSPARSHCITCMSTDSQRAAARALTAAYIHGRPSLQGACAVPLRRAPAPGAGGLARCAFKPTSLPGRSGGPRKMGAEGWKGSGSG